MKKRTGLTSFYFRTIVCLVLISPLFIALKSTAQSENTRKIKTLEKEMIAAHEQKEYKKILLIGDSMLAIAPANKRVLGSCYNVAWNEFKDTVKSLAYLKLAVAQHPFDQYFLSNYSWLLLLDRQPVKALPICKKAYQFDRSSIPAIINYAHCLYLIGTKTFAEELYDEALALTTSMDAYTKTQDADYELLHKIFPYAKFDALRLQQKQKAQIALAFYQSANKLYNEFTEMNVKGKATLPAVLAKINTALTAEKKLEPLRIKRISKYLTTLGYTIYNTGQVKPAVEKYQQAIDYNLLLEDYTELGKIYYNIGVIYKAIRLLDSAYYYFDGAAYCYSLSGNKVSQAGAYTAIAEVLDINGETERALPIIRDSVLPLVEKYNAYEETIDAYIFLSNYYRNDMKEDSSNYYLEKCMETAGINTVEPRKLITVYNQLTIRAFKEKNYRKAKEYLFMTLEAIPEYEYHSLQNLQALQETGTLYYAEKNYDSAKYYFEKSIDILYIMRNTLEYEEKMTFLASNTSLFNQLALCNYQLGNKEGVFKAMEESKSLVLLEKLGGRNEDKLSIEKLQEKMKEDEVYLMTYFSKSDDIFSGKIIMAISKESTAIELLSDSTLLFNAARQPVSPYMDTIFSGFKKLWTGTPDPSISHLRRSSTLILAVYLQTELAKATASSRGLKPAELKEKELHANNAMILGSVFYEAMLKPFEKLLKDKKKIIIIPDGQLSFVPFETLVDEKGKYLTETYNISYLPSIKVAELLLKRQSTYKGTKVALIGNPVYNELSEADMEIGVRPAYRSADAFAWNTLPGTKAEIDSIRKFYKLSTTLSDVNCTEEKFKALFVNPAEKYALVHFATHGHVMDNDAGLSSVVLNQVVGKKKEDGYLTSNEIEAMKIPAQLVVLSACQTGKGLLMDGEGVQGLSSSFMVAGANSLIVSLWSVADKSTSLFMQEVYKLANKEGLSFKAAIQKVKQLFLAGKFGEEFRKPYYWAPFIYIGN